MAEPTASAKEWGSWVRLLSGYWARFVASIDHGLGAGERRVDSASLGYQVIREECDLTIISVATVVTIGGGVAGDTHLLGVMINKALTGTCVITGFAGAAGTAVNITLPAATPAGFCDFKGAINSVGALTVICANAGDTNNVQILSKPI
jgi:hypothetical protein